MSRVRKCFKTCSCGRIHSVVPAIAKYQHDGSDLSGWYWNCDCNSTLFLADDRRSYAASEEDAEADLGDMERKGAIEEELVAS